MTDEERIDKILIHAVEVNPGPMHVHPFLQQLGETDDFVYYYIVRRGNDEGIWKHFEGDRIQATIKGIEIVKAGGYLAHLDRLQQEDEYEKEKEKIEFQKSKYELRNSKWDYAMRWITLIIAIAGLVIGLLALKK